MGSIEILLDPGTVAHVDGVGVRGAFGEHRSDHGVDPAPGAPVVRVRGLALMGSVQVRREALPTPQLGRWSRRRSPPRPRGGVGWPDTTGEHASAESADPPQTLEPAPVSTGEGSPT